MLTLSSGLSQVNLRTLIAWPYDPELFSCSARVVLLCLDVRSPVLLMCYIEGDGGVKVVIVAPDKILQSRKKRNAHLGCLHMYPKGPCTQICTLAPMYLYRNYLKAKVYTIWVHEPIGVAPREPSSIQPDVSPFSPKGPSPEPDKG